MDPEWLFSPDANRVVTDNRNGGLETVCKSADEDVNPSLILKGQYPLQRATLLRMMGDIVPYAEGLCQLKRSGGSWVGRKTRSKCHWIVSVNVSKKVACLFFTLFVCFTGELTLNTNCQKCKRKQMVS